MVDILDTGIGAGSLRQARTGRSLNTYPHAFFDPSSDYIPNSIKELFRWCRYLYMTHSEIAPVINKKCAYVTTKLVYETDSSKIHEVWSEMLDRTLRIREFEFKMLVDYEVYGNGFASIYYPFERYLTCPKCDYQHLARTIAWRYKGDEFVARCTEKGCNYKGNMIPEDKTIKNRTRIRLIRWYPQYIEVKYNPFSDRSEYIYRVPKWLRKKLRNPKINKYLIEDTPLAILKAVKEKKNILLDSNNIFHLKNPSVSMDDDSFGMPPILAVFKDAWLFQTYRRAQESIALDHILPLTLLIPAPSRDGTSPHMSIDLGDWTSRMQRMIQKWRRDPNGIFTVPFPADVQNIRGDAQALNVHNDMTQIRQQITGGLDVPQEFIYGGLNWSGSSISLRVLENLFINRKEQLDRFLKEFVLPNVQRFCDLPDIDIHHRDFKMADDAQQKQIALGLRQTNTISDQTTIEELGFDYDTELKRRDKEEDERINSLERTQLAQAETQGRSMIIQARYQSLAQAEAEKTNETELAQGQSQGFAMSGMDPMQQQAAPGQEEAAPGQEGAEAAAQEGAAPAEGEQMAAQAGPPPDAQAQQVSGGTNMPEDPIMLDMLAQHYLKTIPPSMLEQELQLISQSNPRLAAAIQNRIKKIKEQTAKLRPLPEQKPPRRANSPV
jgi:hypothetical protein